jgi:hypothetical protein
LRPFFRLRSVHGAHLACLSEAVALVDAPDDSETVPQPVDAPALIKSLFNVDTATNGFVIGSPNIS